jgi:hypothetical protein
VLADAGHYGLGVHCKVAAARHVDDGGVGQLPEKLVPAMQGASNNRAKGKDKSSHSNICALFFGILQSRLHVLSFLFFFFLLLSFFRPMPGGGCVVHAKGRRGDDNGPRAEQADEDVDDIVAAGTGHDAVGADVVQAAQGLAQRRLRRVGVDAVVRPRRGLQHLQGFKRKRKERKKRKEKSEQVVI